MKEISVRDAAIIKFKNDFLSRTWYNVEAPSDSEITVVQLSDNTFHCSCIAHGIRFEEDVKVTCLDTTLIGSANTPGKIRVSHVGRDLE